MPLTFGDGPYGLGFGAGAAGAGIAQGLVQGLQLGPQIQQARLQNQATQAQLRAAEEQRKIQEEQRRILRTPEDSSQEILTPYDQPLQDLKKIKIATKAGGDLEALARINKQEIDLMHERASHLVGAGVRNALIGNTQGAEKFLNMAGINVKGLRRNPNGTFTADVNGEPQTFDYQTLYALSHNPSQLLDLHIRNEWYKTQAGYREKSLEHRIQKDAAQQKLQVDRLQALISEGEKSRQAAETRARIAASSGIARTKITQAGALQRQQEQPKNVFFKYLTLPEDEGGLGLNADEAMTHINSIEQYKKAGIAPGKWASDKAVELARASLINDPEAILALRENLLKIAPEPERPVLPPIKSKGGKQAGIKFKHKPSGVTKVINDPVRIKIYRDDPNFEEVK